MLFAVICRDRPDNPPNLQPETRPAHLAYLQSLGGAVRFGGPLLGDDAETRVGSLIMLEAENLEAARALVARDPYVLAGIFEVVEVRPCRQVVGAASLT